MSESDTAIPPSGKQTAAIILAAGKGTRMKSDRAKVIFELAGKPMIQRVVDTALQLECAKVCVVVGHQKDTVINAITPHKSLVFANQSEQLGTGHAIMIAEQSLKGFEGEIFILSGDVPLLKAETLSKMRTAHHRTGAACTVLTAVLDDAGKYGRILRDEAGNVTGIVEYKDATEEQRKIGEFNTGIWCFSAEALFSAIHKIDNNNAQKEYYLTDTLQILVSEGYRVNSVILDDLSQASGVNSQEQLTELETIYLDQIKKHWLNNGVMIHNPATVYIGEDVTFETDVNVEAHTTIKGKSHLEKSCHIGTHCYIEHATIGAEAILEGYNIIIDANVNDAEIIRWRETVMAETP
jgi:UDP-N-acetylglucosamine diphosphorylase/glucosamine-1-phosphate N-acetyltransferase